jgi:hypothetical protein
MNRPDELHTCCLEARASGFDVVDLETRNRASPKVSVLLIGGPEDLNNAAVGKLKCNEVLLLMVERKS